MPDLEIVAHRGAPAAAPENTIPAFQRAIELGADAVELDVRLTRDQVPLVFHFFYLEQATGLPGTIFDYTGSELQEVEIRQKGRPIDGCHIPALREVLDKIGGRIGLEIEVKGPEPESAAIVGAVLHEFRPLWASIEITSYEPVLLTEIRRLCPGLATDLLFPLSESWMKPDVVTHLAIHRSRLAGARAVHLHPTQLSAKVVAAVRSHGIEVHAHGVNDEPSLQQVVELGIPRLCTDRLEQALEFRQRGRIAQTRARIGGKQPE